MKIPSSGIFNSRQCRNSRPLSNHQFQFPRKYNNHLHNVAIAFSACVPLVVLTLDLLHIYALLGIALAFSVSVACMVCEAISNLFYRIFWKQVHRLFNFHTCSGTFWITCNYVKNPWHWRDLNPSVSLGILSENLY